MRERTYTEYLPISSAAAYIASTFSVGELSWIWWVGESA